MITMWLGLRGIPLASCGSWGRSGGGRAGQGVRERPADRADPVAVAGERLLTAAGWLDVDPCGPSERLRSLLPAGAPLAAMHGFVRELLAMVSWYAEGAASGWAETD